MNVESFEGQPCVCQFRRPRCDQTCVAHMMETNFYMAAIDLSGRRCLVVGAGAVGLEKIEGLLASDAEVRVVAPRANPEVVELAESGSIEWRARRYESRDLDDCFLAVAATSDTEVNISVYADAEARSMLVNVVDVPPLCNFILPAIVRRGPIAIAISTAGASPTLAKRMKEQVAELFGEEYATLALMLNEVRGWAKATLPTYQDRKAFFEQIVNGEPDPLELLRRGERPAVKELIARAQESHGS
ncbi:MAG: precorrin-2 dehydrogenase/sirohydrochlorin ferrochelatase family protein [Actinomycetota bacterium]